MVIVLCYLADTKMHLQTFISVLVWVAVICFKRVVSDKISKSELADKLNMLVQHSGWRYMDNIKILKSTSQSRENADPISGILEAISSGRKPIEEFNVAEKYKEIRIVLRCKYAEVLCKYRVLIQHLIRVCRIEKRNKNNPELSFLRYYNCFHSLLMKLHFMSSKFKCMTDALVLVNSLEPLYRAKKNIIHATQKLSEWTFNIGPRTLSKFSENGINRHSVDLEIKSISEYIVEVFNNIVNKFVTRNCDIPSHKDLTPEVLNNDFKHKKRNHQIPMEMTFLQYVEDEINCYAEDISDSCFYNLGFTYDETENVIVRII